MAPARPAPAGEVVPFLGVGMMAGLFALLLVDAAATRAGLVAGLPSLGAMAGTTAWIASRAAGVTALLALTLDVVFGLLVSTRAADRVLPRARSVEVHRALSVTALTLAAAHAVVLMGDRVVRFDLIDVIVPFASSYRPLAVGLGVLAAWGLVVLEGSFRVRSRIGARTWRKLHYLSFAVFAGAVAHGVMAGSDAGLLGMRLFYLAVGGVVAALAGIRVVQAARAGTGTRQRQGSRG